MANEVLLGLNGISPNNTSSGPSQLNSAILLRHALGKQNQLIQLLNRNLFGACPGKQRAPMHSKALCNSSISHLCSWLCFFYGTSSYTSQMVMSFWATGREGPRHLRWVSVIAKTLRDDAAAAAAGQPSKGLKPGDFADGAACLDPHHPQTLDTVSWMGYMFLFWVSVRCAVI